MKKLFISASLAASIIAISVLPSCKKSESDPSRSEMLTGTWKSTEEGVDSNANGSWDASERKAVATADVATIVFNADGTGTSSGSLAGMPISLPFTWSLQNSEKDLRMITSFFGTADTSTQTIMSISSSDIALKDATETPATFMAAKKQ